MEIKHLECNVIKWNDKLNTCLLFSSQLILISWLWCFGAFELNELLGTFIRTSASNENMIGTLDVDNHRSTSAWDSVPFQSPKFNFVIVD